MTLEDMKQMKPPERPKELAMLEPMVGSWKATAECHMAGMDKPMSGHGTHTLQWECGGWLLVERMEWEMPDMAEMGKMIGMACYSFDPKEKEFETCWMNNFGEVADGDMRYDEASKVWHIKSDGCNRLTGQKSRSKGTMRMPDANTIEWTHVEYDASGMNKTMEMKGTSKRQ